MANKLLTPHTIGNMCLAMCPEEEPLYVYTEELFGLEYLDGPIRIRFKTCGEQVEILAPGDCRNLPIDEYAERLRPLVNEKLFEIWGRTL